MTKDNPGASRQHRILKALVAHGPLTLPGIRKYVCKPVHDDLRLLCKIGYIVEAGMVPTGPTSPVKELPSFKATPEGAAHAATDLDPIRRGPGKKSKGADFVITKASKATVKLTPMDDVEITYTDSTKYTTYEPKYTFRPYQQPKNFMECVR